MTTKPVLFRSHEDAHADACAELRAILAAPRQPAGDYGWLVGLELPEVQCNCAWNPDSHDKTCPVYLRDHMADAQRAIAELREECERLRVFNKSLDEEATKRLQDVIEAENEAHTLRQQSERVKSENEHLARHIDKMIAERDTMRQQLAELRAQLLAIASAEPRRHTIEWAKAMAATGNNEAYAKWREAFDQRDRLAGLLAKAQEELDPHRHAVLWGEICTALAEVK